MSVIFFFFFYIIFIYKTRTRILNAELIFFFCRKQTENTKIKVNYIASNKYNAQVEINSQSAINKSNMIIIFIPHGKYGNGIIGTLKSQAKYASSYFENK